MTAQDKHGKGVSKGDIVEVVYGGDHHTMVVEETHTHEGHHYLTGSITVRVPATAVSRRDDENPKGAPRDGTYPQRTDHTHGVTRSEPALGERTQPKIGPRRDPKAEPQGPHEHVVTLDATSHSGETRTGSHSAVGKEQGAAHGVTTPQARPKDTAHTRSDERAGGAKTKESRAQNTDRLDGGGKH